MKPRRASSQRLSTVNRTDLNRKRGNDRGNDMRRLLHELEVQRVELEAQNAELRRAQADRAAALAVYADLYTYAPVGYVTLTSRGVITEANRIAVKQLRMTRSDLERTTIQSLVAPECADSVSALLRDPHRKHFHGSLEVRLPGADHRGPRTMQFVIARARGMVLLAMLDFTEIRRLEQGVREALRLERERLRADLHDGLGQELTGLSLALAALREECSAADLAWAPKLEQLRVIAANAITTCRTIVHGLAPVARSGGGLIAALEMLAKTPRRAEDPSIEMAVTEQSLVQVDEAAADHLYRIAQEAITNAIKHGHATAIQVSVEVSEKTLTVEVADNGTGATRSANPGYGLDIMRYRAREVHGELTIVRSAGGTRIRCTCPNSGDYRTE
jgi:signal transduction histidine kinase